jgi:hypothetical protein
VGASEVRTAPDAHNTLKHMCDDVFSLFEDLDGFGARVYVAQTCRETDKACETMFIEFVLRAHSLSQQ